MPEFLTSKLRKSPTGLPSATERGWITSRFATLGILAENLDSATDFPPGVFVDAIPDLWGKALVFGYALGDASHPFHTAAIGAFRGFLTMLALRTGNGYLLRAFPVNLDVDTERRFVSTAASLIPAGTLSPGMSWDPTYIFMLDGEVVGMTSPLTIIAPKEGMDLTRATSLGLTDGFRFIDTTKRLDSSTAAEVASWVGDLAARLVRLGAGEPAKWHGIVTSVLRDFYNDLVRRAAGQIIPEVKPSMDSLGMAGVCGNLVNCSLAGRAWASDVELTRTEGCGASRLLVIDTGTPGQWGVSPQDVLVWGRLTHATINGQSLGRDRTKLGATLLDRMEWTKPEDLLLDTLTVVTSDTAFRDAEHISGTEQLAGMSPLLPVTELLAQYLHPDYIAAHSRFAATGNGIQFSLDLPVGNQGRTIEARKIYPLERLGRVDPIQLPVCEIWPGVNIKGWKTWYSFCSNAGINARYVLKPLGALSAETQERLPSGDPDVVLAISKSKPTVVGLRELQAVPGGRPREVYRGLIIPAYHEAPSSGVEASVEVGFDFGTTGTEVYIKVGDRPPHRLALATQTASVTNIVENARLGSMHRYFMPPGDSDETGPFLSLLRRRRDCTEFPRPVEIEQAHVLFYRSQNSKDQLDDPHLHSYLKWAPKLNGDREAFLRQFALLAAVEAVRLGARSIRFRYSYPTAFDTSQKNWMTLIWPQIIEGLKQHLPDNCEVFLDPPKTESVAAAQYFRDINYAGKALTDVGSLVMDIGGGTSDLSLWKDGSMNIQTSLRWSAREILLRAFEANRDDSIALLFDQLEAPEHFQRPFKEKQGDAFYRYADALLRSHGDVLIRNLVNANGRPEYVRLCSHIALTFGGLMYYCGTLLKTAAFEKVPRVFVAGNGSRVLHWLSPVKYSSNSPFHRLFRDAIYTGAGIDSNESLQLTVSQEPKCEAARGLVTSVGRPLEDKNPENGEAVVSGEAFLVDGIEKDQTGLLTAELFTSRRIEIRELTELRIWLEIYNGFAVSSGQLISPVADLKETLERARDDVRQECLSYFGRDPNEISAKSLFVLGLEAVMHHLKWGNARNAGSS